MGLPAGVEGVARRRHALFCAAQRSRTKRLSWRRNQDLPSASSSSEQSALVPVGHEAVLRPGGSRGGI